MERGGGGGGGGRERERERERESLLTQRMKERKVDEWMERV